MEGSYEAAAEAADWLRGRLGGVAPRVGLICGSGLGGLVGALEGAQSAPYGDVPHFKPASVPGHAGRVVWGLLGGVPVIVLQGRSHLYEGHGPAQVALPVRALALLGVHTLVLTNAAGSLRRPLRPGQLLLLRDHIDLPGLAGNGVLLGPNDDRFGPRFPVMAAAYDPALRRAALALAPPALRPRPGVYVGVSGPAYETPAECRLLRRLGADAVGMSTVGEATAARHLGLRVLGLSLITNMAAGGGASDDEEEEEADRAGPEVATPSEHAAVLEAAEGAAVLIRDLLVALAPLLANRDAPPKGAGP
ncbi:purine nucleoside phosphorylase-like isoform X7 [Columba livia]|uniref:purine nucleoside phosphorylase-like isoform X7 n=1 Tax=Columba livia TaxID=8932 RepID=UPI0031BA6F21